MFKNDQISPFYQVFKCKEKEKKNIGRRKEGEKMVERRVRGGRGGNE